MARDKHWKWIFVEEYIQLRLDEQINNKMKLLFNSIEYSEYSLLRTWKLIQKTKSSAYAQTILSGDVNHISDWYGRFIRIKLISLSINKFFKTSGMHEINSKTIIEFFVSLIREVQPIGLNFSERQAKKIISKFEADGWVKFFGDSSIFEEPSKLVIINPKRALLVHIKESPDY